MRLAFQGVRVHVGVHGGTVEGGGERWELSTAKSAVAVTTGLSVLSLLSAAKH